MARERQAPRTVIDNEAVSAEDVEADNGVGSPAVTRGARQIGGEDRQTGGFHRTDTKVGQRHALDRHAFAKDMHDVGRSRKLQRARDPLVHHGPGRACVNEQA